MPDLATFAMPSKLEVNEESSNDTYGLFVAEPLEKGFGHTMGNAMRRCRTRHTTSRRSTVQS